MQCKQMLEDKNIEIIPPYMIASKVRIVTYKRGVLRGIMVFFGFIGSG